MENEFIPYEESLALKELGFNEPCCQIYYNSGENELSPFYSSPIVIDDMINIADVIKAPLYQQAFRWFREKYELNSSIYKWHPDFSKTMGHLEWEGIVTHFSKKKIGGSEFFNTYKEAELFCIKKLIEIIENK